MRIAALLAGLLLVLAACGDDSPTLSGADEAGRIEEPRSRCEAGEYTMCDILFQASDFESDLETFADTCGGRVASSGDYCADQFAVPIDLSDLQGSCDAGDMAACDLLYLYAPSGSAQESFGDQCGGIGEGSNRTCVVSWGFTVDRG